MKNHRNESDGFTLIELLVVIAIIGILASVILVSLNSARTKARNAIRKEDLTNINTALALYYSDNGQYPVTCTSTCGQVAASNSYGVNGTFGSKSTSGAGGWIPSLAPTYMPTLPVDPSQGSGYGYIYESNGTDYIILDYGSVESCGSGGTAGDTLVRPAAPTQCDYAVYSSGGVNW